MSEIEPQPEQGMEPVAGERERSAFPAAFAAGIVVMAIVVLGVVLLSRGGKSHMPAATDQLPFGAVEQAYAPQIHFTGLQMAQSSNLLNQQFTYVNGTVSNDGTKTVRALAATVEFHDQFNQVVLRQTQQVVGAGTDPLKAGQSHDFQLTIEQALPAEWNQQYPAIRVTGLVLE